MKGKTTTMKWSKRFKKYYDEVEYDAIVLYEDEINKKVYYLQPEVYNEKYEFLIKNKTKRFILIKPNKLNNQINAKTVYDLTTIYCMKKSDYEKEYENDIKFNHLLIPNSKRCKILYLLMNNYNNFTFALSEYENPKTQYIINEYRANKVKNIIDISIKKFNSDNNFKPKHRYYVDASFLKEGR